MKFFKIGAPDLVNFQKTSGAASSIAYVNLVFEWQKKKGIFLFFLFSVSFSGLEAIVVDYIRPSLFGGSTLIPNMAQSAVWILSLATLAGLYYFNYTDVGIVNAMKMFWTAV